MSGAQRWRGQSLVGHEYFTGPQSKADADGHMPVYAHAAYRIASAGAQIAGMAKKRWRDQDAERMRPDDIASLRREIDSAFEELEAAMRLGTDRAQVLAEPAKAQASFVTFGRLGYLALANMEEAGELARPLHSLAVGAGDPAEHRREAGEEAADVRVYLHVTSESLRLNQTTTTEAKWTSVQNRWPEIFGRDARRGDRPKVDMQAAISGLRLEPAK